MLRTTQLLTLPDPSMHKRPGPTAAAREPYKTAWEETVTQWNRSERWKWEGEEFLFRIRLYIRPEALISRRRQTDLAQRRRATAMRNRKHGNRLCPPSRRRWDSTKLCSGNDYTDIKIHIQRLNRAGRNKSWGVQNIIVPMYTSKSHVARCPGSFYFRFLATGWLHLILHIPAGDVHGKQRVGSFRTPVNGAPSKLINMKWCLRSRGQIDGLPKGFIT
jgi:hypothetical protein